MGTCAAACPKLLQPLHCLLCSYQSVCTNIGLTFLATVCKACSPAVCTALLSSLSLFLQDCVPNRGRPCIASSAVTRQCAQT